MKNIIKILALLCLVTGVLFVACACTDDEAPSSQSSTDTPVSDSKTEGSTVDSNPTDSSQNNGPSVDEPVMKDYTVRAADAFGNELEVSVIVEMFKDGVSLGEKPMRHGTAVFNLEEGNYTFTVSPMEGKFYYDEGACTLSADETEKTVTLYTYADETQRQTIHIYDRDILEHVPYDAVQVTEGGMYVRFDRTDMSYFIFTPTRGGIYRFSYESSEDVALGYFGSPHNVLQSCPLEVVDGAFELEIKNDSVQIGNQGGTVQVVVGLGSEDARGCVLKIERIGDVVQELPWTEIHADKSNIKVDNFVNSEFVLFDITNKDLKVVFNENDGYYHLNTADGPLMYVRITAETDTEESYATLPSFITIIDKGNNLCRYFYDEDGVLVRRELYNSMFNEYAALCGTRGLYPLNEQLATAIKNTGEHSGWFNLEGESIVFGENASKVVEENAWLYACVYENPKALGTEEKPAPVAVNSADSAKNYVISVSSGEEIVLRTVAKATLTISNAQDVKVIANDGTEYVADGETGVLSCVITANQNFKIVYEGEENETKIVFTFVEYFG